MKKLPMITDDQVQAALAVLQQYVKEGRAEDHRCVLAVVGCDDDCGRRKSFQMAEGKDSAIAAELSRFMLEDEDVMKLMTKMIDSLFYLLQATWKERGEKGIFMGKKGMA